MGEVLCISTKQDDHRQKIIYKTKRNVRAEILQYKSCGMVWMIALSQWTQSIYS